MRQFILTLKAFYELTEVGETYDAIRSQFPSMDIEKYLNIKTPESREEFINHAKLLLWIYLHEEHSEQFTARLNPHKEGDHNTVILTIDEQKLESIEPRLFKDYRLKSLIEEGILQEVKIVMLSPKELEHLDNILRHVNKFYDNPQENYLDLNLTQGQLDHMIKKFRQEN